MPAVGELVGGRYRLVASIGRGPHGEVFEAEQVGLGRLVAVKIADGEFDRARVTREARATSRIEGSGIVRVLECRMNEEPPFVVSELAKGRSLARLIGKPVDAARVRKIARSLLGALESAHRAGVIHGDLRPSNVFVGGDDAVQIGDFGFADDETDQSHTSTLALRATAGYRAPERIRGAPPDARSDIFAAGVCLYELVAGTRPFQAATGIDELTRVLAGDAAPLASPIGPVVMRAIAKEPSARFASAADMRSAIAKRRSRVPVVLLVMAAVVFGLLVLRTLARPAGSVTALTASAEPVVVLDAPSASDVEPLPPPSAAASVTPPVAIGPGVVLVENTDFNNFGVRDRQFIHGLVPYLSSCRRKYPGAHGDLVVHAPSGARRVYSQVTNRLVYPPGFLECVNGYLSGLMLNPMLAPGSFTLQFY